MNYFPYLLGTTVYSLLLGYAMFKFGYNNGFSRAYYYALLMQKAKKKELNKNEDTIV